MSIVSCDVVEAAAASKDTYFAEVDTLLPTVGYGKSFMFLTVSALLSTAAVSTDTVDMQPVMAVVERASAHDTWTQRADLSTIIVERAAGKDTASVITALDIVERAAAASSTSDSRSVFMEEDGAAASSASYTLGVTRVITDSARAKDILFGFNDYSIVDRATASDSLMLGALFTDTVLESAAAGDELIVAGLADFTIVDAARASSSLFSQLVANTDAIERATARDKLLVDMLAMGWVMNTNTFGMTRYAGLPFTSMAVVGGRVLGLGAGGLYELAGDSDDGAPVVATVSTGFSSLGDDSLKRVPTVHLFGAVPEDMALSVGVYGAHKGTFTYTVAGRTSDAPRGFRANLGKGLASVYWKFTFANKNGARFDINTIDADVAPSTTRRI